MGDSESGSNSETESDKSETEYVSDFVVEDAEEWKYGMRSKCIFFLNKRWHGNRKKTIA